MSLDPVPNELVVTSVDVCNRLSRIKLNKAVGPDCIPNKILKQMAHILGPPLAAIINCSLRQGIVPDIWKLSRITPLPKTMPVQSIESDVRPIAVTNSVAKIAESFVCKYFNFSFKEHTDPNQFGCVHGRSTTQALLQIMHELFQASECSSNIIRILFIDFSKAFDLIDHNILLKKFVDSGLPAHIIAWSLDFVSERKQFVKIGDKCSNLVSINAGTPQGTLSGPNNFKLLINDLSFDLPYIKYVDDTSVLSISVDPNDLSLQAAADHLVEWTCSNSMKVNEQKTKEMLIYFGTQIDTKNIKKIVVNGRDIERVEVFKLLGVIISTDLSWDAHVDYLVSKVAKRIHCLRHLIHAGVKHSDILTIYCSVIRSVLEHACPVWHPGLTNKQSYKLESIQKRILRMVFPTLEYSTALTQAQLERLDSRREKFTKELFEQIKHPDHVLHKLLPPEKIQLPCLRSQYKYEIPIVKKTRFGRDFIPYCIMKRY